MSQTASTPLQAPPPSLGRATLTLLGGGLAAQVVPLALGPWLTRLYTPGELGVWHLFAAAAGTVAVVACARFEFALPLAKDDAEATRLRSLCLWLLLATSLLCLPAAAWWGARVGAAWPWWLAPTVASLAAWSLATMWATRAQRYGALSWSRAVQQGGGAVAQVAAALAGLGLHGLVAAPIVATLASMVGLKLPWRGTLAPRDPALRDAARTHRDFARYNLPHALTGTAVAAVALAMVTGSEGAAAAGFWGLVMRYLMAPATLVGGALSQALYAQLAADAREAGGSVTRPARSEVRRVMAWLLAGGAALALAIAVLGPWLFEWAFGRAWADAGSLARAMAAYIGIHFVASPLGVVTMAWGAQRWALGMALSGAALWLVSIAVGLRVGGLEGAGWAMSASMLVYFGVYLARLATWPVDTTVTMRPTAASGKAAT